MIITTLPNSAPYVSGSGMATKVVSQTLQEVVDKETNDICICDIQRCEYVGKVFASISGADYKNDTSAFMYKRLIPADTVVIKLLKDGVEIATIVDNTYGEYTNGFTSGTDEQQLYVGFLIFWENVLNLNGAGEYKIRAELNILGNTSTQDSITYLLKTYNDRIADGTVVIDTVQNGNISRSQFDYTDLNWVQSFRIPGILRRGAPELTTNFYEKENRERVQIQDSIGDQWEVETKLIPADVSNLINYDNLLANTMTITDYNMYNDEVFRNIPLYPQEITKRKGNANKSAMFTYTFVDRVDDQRKRNY